MHYTCSLVFTFYGHIELSWAILKQSKHCQRRNFNSFLWQTHNTLQAKYAREHFMTSLYQRHLSMSPRSVLSPNQSWNTNIWPTMELSDSETLSKLILDIFYILLVLLSFRYFHHLCIWLWVFSCLIIKCNLEWEIIADWRQTM